MVKPLVKWSGGKSDEISKFINHIPKDYNVYLEPFVGGGAVYFHLCPKNAIITDVHPELVDFYKAIKNKKSFEIHKFMETHPNDETIYYNVRDKMVIDNYLDNAKRFFYLRKTCYRGMMRYNNSGKFNIPFGRYKTYNYDILLDKTYENLFENTQIECRDFSHVFDNFNDEKNFMFLDPPYDSTFTNYGYCSFGRVEQEKLATYFKQTKIRCLMVIGKTPFIEELYKDYIVDEYDKKYRFKLHSNRIGEEINTKHLVIKNFI